MAEKDETDQPKMTEPVIVPCLFCSGVSIEAGENFVRIVGWVDLETVGYGGAERRIIARVIMPGDTARSLIRDLRKVLSKGGN